MFYSEVVLARKGPLGKIWLAAHFDKKLNRNQIFATDISSAVESVLNPTSPLALRVSGHLMLGIVRIYSRKVSYLMTECKEAMWKINLAFRPGTYDMDPSYAAALNLHDARNFGNVHHEYELPVLENAEFPQPLLPEDDFRYGASQGSVFGTEGHTLQDYSLSAESPLIKIGAKSARDISGSGSRLSHVSDLELTRFERAGSLASQQAHRMSLASGKSGRPSGVSVGLGFEDEIPAFQTEGFDIDPFAAPLDFGDTFGPAYEEERLPAEEEEGEEAKAAAAEARRGSRVSSRVQDQRQRKEAEEQEAQEEEGEEAQAEVRAVPAEAAAAKKRKGPKRRRVVIDERVELPARVLKQRMEDMSPIMRQRGTGAAARAADAGDMPAGIRGLCAELQEVFHMATNQLPLPFPLKEGAVAPTSADAQQRAHTEQEELEGQEVELTRAARDSMLSAAGGRPSAFDASFSGKEAGSLTPAGTRLSHESGLRESFAPMDDMGGYGYDDFGQGYDAPLTFRDSFQDQGGPGVEESKRRSGDEPAARRAPTLTASNAISQLVTSAFTRSASEAERDKGAAAHHTRTELFMDILEGEFQSKPKVSFEAVTGGVSKRVAAAAFLEVLQLKTWGRVEVAQSQPFADIQIAPVHVGSL